MPYNPRHKQEGRGERILQDARERLLARMIVDAYLSREHLQDHGGSLSDSCNCHRMCRGAAPPRRVAFRKVLEMG